MEIIHNRSSFWKDNNFPYVDVIELSEPDLVPFVKSLTRYDIIEWLIWNDRNGVYSDEESTREFGTIMTLDEATEILLRQVAENRVSKSCLKIL